MSLETLYKRTKAGGIQYWEIKVTPEGNNAWITKTSGKFDTKSPLVHEQFIEEGKNIGKANETTSYQQAELQARSDWNKKRDEGYKDLAGLGIKSVGLGYITVNDGKTVRSLEKVLEEAVPKFNSDASGNVKPMKAPTVPWKLGQKISYPQRLETKFDGVRATLVIPEDWGNMQFLSSSGKEYTSLFHIKLEVLAALRASRWTIDQYPIVLDGEIYRHGMTLEEINEAVKKLRAETVTLEFRMYDLPLHTGSQTERSAETARIVSLIDSNFVSAVDGVVVNSDADVKRHHDIWVQFGYEGAMLKDPNGLYQQGQRSSYWRKVKEFDDTEFEITGYKLGQRGVEDLIFTCQCPGGSFDVKMSGSRESKQKIYEEIQAGKTEGRLLTVKHFGYTKYDIPNLPTGKALRDKE
ncbi:MAG TPA: hypothetical protein VGM30_10485 [Puia sp.]|jgi:ATP-dependent DNA ligase